jgi:hypothetical protein
MSLFKKQKISFCQYFYIVISFFGCTSHQQKSKMTADPALVLPYTFSLENEKHLDAPYVAKFESNGKLLLYVASEHISSEKFPDLLNHPTLRTISNLFSEFKPEIVIVEGINTGADLSPKSILSQAEKCEQSRYQGCSESFFAINEARLHGAEYITGEPEEIQIKEQILSEGFSNEDLLGFYLVRQIPQLKRQAEFDRANFPAQADKLLRRFERKIGSNLNFRFKEFERWYIDHAATKKNYFDVTADDAAPDSSPQATYVQKISAKVGLIRDRSIVKTIGLMAENYSRILVVYGGSHLLTQEPALVSLFGKPTYFRSLSAP